MFELNKIVVASTALLLVACSHNASIRAVARGQYDIVARGATESAALAEAYAGARDACPNYVLLNKKSRYQGAVGSHVGGLSQPLRSGASLKHFDETINKNVGYIVNLRIRCSR